MVNVTVEYDSLRRVYLYRDGNEMALFNTPERAIEGLSKELGNALCEVERLAQQLTEMTKERDEYRRLYDFRGKVLLRPCRQCGYKPTIIKPAGGIKHD